MPAARSEDASSSVLNCGTWRDLGMERTVDEMAHVVRAEQCDELFDRVSGMADGVEDAGRHNSIVVPIEKLLAPIMHEVRLRSRTPWQR